MLNISTEELSVIEDYLDSKLTDAELVAFEKRLEEEPLLAEKIAQVKFLRDGIERTALKFKMEEFHQKAFPSRSTSRFLRPTWMWSAAASLLVIIGALGWWSGWFDSNSDKLFYAYYAKDPGFSTVMSNSDNYEFDRGMVEYKSGNYSKSLEFWIPLLDQKPQNDTLLYLVAMNELEINELQRSQTHLTQVLHNETSHFAKDANWYLGLISIKKGEFKQAIPYLEASSRKEADELISKLKKELD